MDKMRERVKDLGTRTDDISKELGTHSTQLADQERWLQPQEAMLEVLEDTSRCNNVCVLGLPGGTETTPVEQFLESWLVEILCGLGNEGVLLVGRAHRTPGGKSKPGAPPRMLIMQMLRYKDKMNIVAEARQKGNVEYKRTPKLRDKGLNLALLPPVCLCIDFQGKRHFFYTEADDMQFVEYH
ncbi:hypothetical protein NDU88_001810 [Pleurodeles waltl]|uniref:Uncharacterized protein n=1 Tax=Pleurodeles waltl TaxID=8319 RepID=A0AAV7WM13_PLEWA|nr:hypothetical protein NDU88_001810 [Pleurodeles waltl]